VVVAGAGANYSGNGNDDNGGRSSGANENDDTVHGRINGWHLRVLRALTRPTGICTGPFGHRSLVGDELVRRRASGVMETTATVRLRARR
jgi:hypothetical protein